MFALSSPSLFSVSLFPVVVVVAVLSSVFMLMCAIVIAMSIAVFYFYALLLVGMRMPKIMRFCTRMVGCARKRVVSGFGRRWVVGDVVGPLGYAGGHFFVGGVGWGRELCFLE
ncbi:hypothetical protein BDR22DRAFT_847391 [Usnea florida]